MNYLTDVKAERFLCTQCREYAKIVVLEEMERVHTRFLTKVSVLSETPHRFSPYLLACGVL